MIEIIRTNPGKADFYGFTDLPKNIYDADSLRFKTPETIPEEFLKGCYILLDCGKPVARASIYDNPLLEYKYQHALTIGNYECMDNPEYAARMLAHLQSEARLMNAPYLIGPMNGSTWESYRFGLSDENRTFFTEQVHHLYYNRHFTDAGFKCIAHYYSNIDRSMTFDRPEILERAQELSENGVAIRSIDLSHFEEEIERIYEFNLVAFKTNFLYTPIRKEAFIAKYAHTKNYIDPEFTLLAEDKNQDLIGYFFCIRDFFSVNEKSLIVKTLARHPDPKWSGLGHVIGNYIYRKAAELHYKNIIHSFVYHNGKSTRLTANFSGINYKNYALYGKQL
jgi:L-amino acid N-acyltransferase YncA